MDELMIQVAPNALAAINKMICPPDQLNDKDNLKALIEEINLIKKS
jgi:hypothetical protein